MQRVLKSGATVTGVRQGQGPELLVLHSLLTDAGAFDTVLPELAKDYTVTILNLPGFRGSTPIAASMDAYVDWIDEAATAFGMASPGTVLGNGFGGTLAVAFTLGRPERVTRLIVCDAAAGFSEQGRQAFRVMQEKVAAGGLGSVAEIAANRVFHAEYIAANPGVVEERRKALMAIHPDSFQAACTMLISCDLVGKLPSIKAETVVICGELDQATPPVLGRQIAENVPGGRYIELPKIGHCPPLEAPAAFLAAFRS
jgi:3-oxoadipate enol-lactonase